MRFLLGLLALFPVIAAAQDLGTYQIDNGTIVSLGGANSITRDGFTARFQGYPAPLFDGGYAYGSGGETNFSVGLQPPGFNVPDMYMSILSEPAGLSNEGLVPFETRFNYEVPINYIEETGAITAPLPDITQAGTYEAPFTMSVDAYFEAPGSDCLT